MRRIIRAALLLAAAAGWGLAATPRPAPAEKAQETAAGGREIAITFDDLPAVSVARGDPDSLALFTDRLLANFTTRHIPVVGFVNEGKLTVPGEGLEAKEKRVRLLARWVAAGLELGNHSYSHRSLNDLPIEEFEADVVRGEPVTLTLLSAQPRPLRYFRHPFLHVGLDLEKRRAFEAWLHARGYAVAPVTIDNDEYIFAAVYAQALRDGDAALAAKTAASYLDYMDRVFDFFEKLSESLFSRPIRHVLLLHANELNADHGGELFDRMSRRGYQFVTLARALEDPAFASKDDYVGRWGISWMHHWELALGRPRTGSPDPPAWMTAAYERSRR